MQSLKVDENVKIYADTTLTFSHMTDLEYEIDFCSVADYTS